MAQYLLLIVGDDDAYAQLSEEEGKAVYAGHDAFMNGLHHALYVASLIAFAGALTAALTVRSHARAPQAPEAVPQQVA